MIDYPKVMKRSKDTKMMIDCGLNKTQLREKTGITTNAIAKMGKGEKVSMDVLVRICRALNCNIGDIMDVLPETEEKIK